MDKEKLFAPRIPTDTVTIPGVGEVKVRGLSRAEAMILQSTSGTAATERKLLHFGMVDPKLTEAEAGKWQEASVAGELEPVSTRITELSGLMPDATKSGVQDDGESAGS